MKLDVTAGRARACLRVLRFAACALLLAPVALAAPPPPSWYQVNQNGFVPGLGASSGGTELLVFGGDLYAFNDQGLFRMTDPVGKAWSQVTPPAPPGGPGATPDTLRVLGGFLYAWNGGSLWWIASGSDPAGPGWTAVTSTGPPGGTSPVPLVLFNGRIYGIYRNTATGVFEIWRTSNVAAAAAVWERVVSNSFGDPTNNDYVDLMIPFNGRVYAAVSTLLGLFGDPRSYGAGVEIWESPSGDSGSWTQVNVDGFGTLFPGCINPGTPFQVCNFAIHQVTGSAAVYRPAGATQDYLYVGTKSHFGAEIWRYDGTGLAGWTNVTPSWAGPCLFGCGPGRNESMAVFRGSLYVAEGFPTANLGGYDGTTWTQVVVGPDPFDPNNRALTSAAVRQDKLYVTAGWPAGATGDQAWGYPFTAPVARCRSVTVPTDPGACTASASVDDGSSDAEGGPLSLTLQPPGPYSAGTTNVTLTVADADGQTDTCQGNVTVQDNESPTITITWPPEGSCHRGPVTVTDVSSDNCTAPLPHQYHPAGGPTYAVTGDYHVIVTVQDAAGYTASDDVRFTVDASPPSVVIVRPSHDETGLPPLNIPITIALATHDSDGATGGVVHEWITLEGCPIYDGASFGDGDGLLSDEGMQLNRYGLCQIMAGCGFDVLHYPRIHVGATDACGNDSFAARILRRRLLRTEVCARR